jgi:hypothetical protein
VRVLLQHFFFIGENAARQKKNRETAEKNLRNAFFNVNIEKESELNDIEFSPKTRG